MRYLIPATMIMLCLASLPGHAAKTGIGVDDYGRDGDEHYYRVSCMDGQVTKMIYLPREGRTCYFDAKGDRKCLKTQDIDAVAVRACAEK